MTVAEIGKLIGELIGPSVKEIFRILLDYWRQPEDGIRIEATKEQKEETKEVNDEWDAILQEYDLPADYRDAYGVLPPDRSP